MPADHFGTLRDHRTGKPDWWGVAQQVLLPILAGGAAWQLGAVMTDVTGAVMVTVVVAGGLFALALFLFQLRITPNRDQRLGPGDCALIDESMANVLWGACWGLILAVQLVACGTGGWLRHDSRGPALTGLLVAGATHLLFVAGMCLKRVRRAYERIAMRRR